MKRIIIEPWQQILECPSGPLGEFLMRMRLRQAGFDMDSEIRRVDYPDGTIEYGQLEGQRR